MKYSFFLFIFLLGCQKLTHQMDRDYYVEVDPKTGSEYFGIVFSHNVNGEMEPCGCRQFPLGGMPQVAGKLFELRNKMPIIYADAGDTFFPTTFVPHEFSDSQHFIANQLAESFESLKLNFYLPGDQDLSDPKWLSDLSKKSSFKFLMTNYAGSEIQSIKKMVMKVGNRRIIFYGILNPELYDGKLKLTAPVETLRKELKEADADDLIVVLSHSGLEFDQQLASDVPGIDWIIGSHTQSFLRKPVVVNETQIAQVLSKNHYLGFIQVPLSLKGEAKYEILEMREEIKDLYPENPFIKKLANYRTELKKIQQKEQEQFVVANTNIQKVSHIRSCMECHQTQVNFWSGTAHALAYLTLVNKEAQHNPACIGCHSVHYQKPSGFASTHDIFLSEQGRMGPAYWKKVKDLAGKVKVVRAASVAELKGLSKEWMKLDETSKVKHNFANVQCLNCHQKDLDHPFSLHEKKSKVAMQACLGCHTADQSPAWYDKGKVKKEQVSGFMKSVACPKG